MTQSRRMLVLRAVVEDYIRSQEPVGSTSLTRDHDLGVSSATIRNDMSALEDEGYLIQPHTSAGRVPTEKGYRYFVDRLATVVPLSEAQRRGINSFLSGSVSLKDALQRSARLLSEITGQVAIVTSPSLAKATLRHVEMVPVAMTTLLAVVITDTGRVAQHGLTIASMPAVDEINRLSNTVNEQCDGLSLSKSAETVRSIAASAGYESVRGVADALADAFESMALDERADELYMSGTSHLAHSRSLADLAPLFDALEEQVVLMKLMSNLSEETNASGVGVAIGIYGCGLDGPDSAESWAQYNEDGTVTIGRTGGERSRRRTRNRIRDGEPDERHGTHRLRWLHRADPHGLRGHYGRRQGRSQIFDRLPLRGPDPRLTAVCGTMTRRPNEHKGSIKWQIITRRWVWNAAPVTTRSRRHTASSAVSTTPTSRALNSRTSSRK